MEFEGFVESLISTVGDKKSLWDKIDPFHHNKLCKEKAWEEVAQCCARTGLECKQRWKLLREKFSKELRKMEQPSGSGASKRVAWKYMESLMFLKSSIEPRRTRCNEESAEGSFQNENDHLENIENDECNSSSAATAPKRLKACIASKIEQFGDTLKKWEESFVITNKETQTDEDELFLKTILSMMKDLPNAVKDNYKSEMFNKLLRLRAVAREGQNNL